jgi:hypothetical protein
MTSHCPTIAGWLGFNAPRAAAFDKVVSIFNVKADATVWISVSHRNVGFLPSAADSRCMDLPWVSALVL